MRHWTAGDPLRRAVVRASDGAPERFRSSGEQEDLNTSKRATCSALRVWEGDCFVSLLDRGSRGVEEEERIMSYSCTSTGNSQDPSSSKKSGGVNPGSCSSSSSGDTGNGNNRHSIRGSKANSNPDLSEAMKVKKGCNTTDVGVPVTTEEELLANKTITPEDVLGLQKITESKWPSGSEHARNISPNIVTYIAAKLLNRLRFVSTLASVDWVITDPLVYEHFTMLYTPYCSYSRSPGFFNKKDWKITCLRSRLSQTLGFIQTIVNISTYWCANIALQCINVAHSSEVFIRVILPLTGNTIEIEFISYWMTLDMGRN